MRFVVGPDKPRISRRFLESLEDDTFDDICDNGAPSAEDVVAGDAEVEEALVAKHDVDAPSLDRQDVYDHRALEVGRRIVRHEEEIEVVGWEPDREEPSVGILHPDRCNLSRIETCENE